MPDTIAALTIPYQSYWGFLGAAITSYAIGASCFAVLDAVGDTYRPRWLGPVFWRFIRPTLTPMGVVRGLIGNAILTGALVLMVVHAEVRDLPDAARLALLALIPVLVLLLLAILFDGMPWRVAAVLAGNWSLKLLVVTYFIADAILYPENLHY